LNNHNDTRMKSEGLLVGRIFDDRGNRMSPSHARKQGVKYRYYLSAALLDGRPGQAGSVHRIPALEIEALVIRSVRNHLKLPDGTDDRIAINDHVGRVDVQTDQLIIHVVQPSEDKPGRDGDDSIVRVPWCKTPSKRRRELLLPSGTVAQQARPVRSESRALLVASIARGRQWLAELLKGANAESIASRERCSVRKVNMTISLAFLAPDLVKAAIEGRLPRGMGVARLCDLPPEWSRQYEVLGLQTP
jgi:hypothetical protein